MVVGVYPVAYVQPATVDWQGFAREDVVDHKRYKLLGVLVWPVVVRAAGDAHRQSEGVFICQYHKVGRRFGSRIWRRGSQRRAFAERHRAVEPTLGASAKTAVHIVGERASFGDVDVEVAVYLVGAYVHEFAQRGRLACCQLCRPLSFHAVEKVESASDVGGEEGARIGETSVYMRFCGKVYDVVGEVIVQDAAHKRAVADVAFYKGDFASFDFTGNRFDIAAVCEGVEHHYACFGFFSAKKLYEVCADEAGAAGHQICVCAFHYFCSGAGRLASWSRAVASIRSYFSRLRLASR